MSTQVEAELCTTESRRRRHYSVDLAPSARRPGRVGRTFCGNTARDEVFVNARRKAWGLPLITVASLPACIPCKRANDKRTVRIE